MQAVKGVFLHAFDCPFLLHQPPGLPGLEALDGFFTVLGGEDELGPFQTMSPSGVLRNRINESS